MVATVGFIYQELLHRDLDSSGRKHWLAAMRSGLTAADVAVAVAKSEEYTNRIAAERFYLPSLRELRPDRFHNLEIEGGGGKTMAVFEAGGSEDYDWLEKAILDFGYYNKPGIWMDEINSDKRVMAEIIASFSPSRPLEVGCSTGGILYCLLEKGIHGEGLEISARAKRDAYPEIRDAIHLGDLLSAGLAGPYDLIYGLDVFEHLNPNRLRQYLDAIRAIVSPDGWLFCNIPAFGPDEVFGEVFPIVLPGWREDQAAGRPFRQLEVDADGYPMHGHLIWAGAKWWVEKFEQIGLHRQPDIERVVHATYDQFFEAAAPARKSFFVFSADPAPDVASMVSSMASKLSSVMI